MKFGRHVSVVLGIVLVSFAAGRWSAPLTASGVAHAGHAADDAGDAKPAAMPTKGEAGEPDEAMIAEMKAWEAASKRTERHDVLEALIGDWNGEVRIWMQPSLPPLVAPTHMHREWVLDGRFVREVVESETEFGSFRGLGYTGYSNVDGVYQFAWMENHGTAIDFQSGTYDPDTKQLTTRGGYRHPHTGRYVMTRSVLDMSDENRHVAEMYSLDEDGREHRTFLGVFERE